MTALGHVNDGGSKFKMVSFSRTVLCTLCSDVKEPLSAWEEGFPRPQTAAAPVALWVAKSGYYRAVSIDVSRELFFALEGFRPVENTCPFFDRTSAKDPN